MKYISIKWTRVNSSKINRIERKREVEEEEKREGKPKRSSITTVHYNNNAREYAIHAYKRAFNVINIIKTVSFVRWDRSIFQTVSFFASNCACVCVCASGEVSQLIKEYYTSILLSSFPFSLSLSLHWTREIKSSKNLLLSI